MHATHLQLHAAVVAEVRVQIGLHPFTQEWFGGNGKQFTEVAFRRMQKTQLG